MNILTVCTRFFFLTALVSYTALATAQSPGIIVRPAGGNGATFLNPNADGYASSSVSGFVSNDIAESEIPYKVVPPVITEPTGDLATGPNGGFSDIVKTFDNSGFYLYHDGVNLLFRLRIGNIISGSKGYSILLDTDGKIGRTGPYADPNYVASTNTSNGNPGFEYEIVFETNFSVSVYNVDGTQSPVLVTSYPLSTHSQISVARTTDSGNPDYFYDFGIPYSAIGSPASFRMVATTVTSPASALQGSRSDIYGIDDSANPNTPNAWEKVIDAQPPVTPAGIGSGGTGPGAVCTAAPSVNGPINIGSGITVSGNWTRLDATKPSTATITLYKNGVVAGTTPVTTGNTWSVSVASIATGDVFYARASASGESTCLQSASVTAGCTSAPASPVLTCASSKGISGTIPAGSTVLIYLLPTTNALPTSNPLTTNITYPTPTSFAYYVNGCSGGASNVANGTYMLVASNGSCTSAPVFECISSGSSSLTGLAANTLSLATPMYPGQSTITGSGAAAGNILRLFINGEYVSTVTAGGTAFSFTGLNLKAGDQARVYLSTGTTCMTASSTFTVSCYTAPPAITTTASGNLVSTATAVSGTSAYAGATVTLFQGTAPTGVVVGSPATTGSNGNWTISGISLTAGQNYYATLTYASCTSPASAQASAQAPTTVCASIAGSYGEAATSIPGTFSAAFTGTVRLYLDGALIGSSSVSGATSWSIPVNSSATNTLYAGGVLTATTQSGTGAEKTDCVGSVTISCSTPVTPSVSPVYTAIAPGQTVTFTISNSVAGILYSIKDNTVNTYYASSKFGTGGTLSITTNSFTTTGTYGIQVKATSFSGPACESQAVASVVVSTTLPAILLSFSAHNEGAYARLAWTTANETNVSHFEIQRSYDGSQFNSLGTMAAVNNANVNNYTYKDAQPMRNLAWYRLAVVDVDGKQVTSKAVKLTGHNTSGSIRVGPNPFTDELLITIDRPIAREGIEIRFTDITGRLARTERPQIPMTGVVHIRSLQSLRPGIYLVQLFQNGMLVKQEKLLKQD